MECRTVHLAFKSSCTKKVCMQFVHCIFSSAMLINMDSSMPRSYIPECTTGLSNYTVRRVSWEENTKMYLFQLLNALKPAFFSIVSNLALRVNFNYNALKRKPDILSISSTKTMLTNILIYIPIYRHSFTSILRPYEDASTHQMEISGT